MSKTIAVKLPSPLENKLNDYMKKEDKDNRNATVCELLEKALSTTEKGMAVAQGHSLNALVEICSTKVALQVNRAVSEILRYTYDPTRSQFPDCQTVEEVVEKISAAVDNTMTRFTGSKGDTDI